MVKRSEILLSYFCNDIYGETTVTGEFNHKKRIRWIIMAVFGSVFAIICALGVLEMLRTSTILIDIQRLKDDIKVIDGNNTALIHELIGKQQDICLKRDFYFIRESQYCIKRDKQRVAYASANSRCTMWTYDRLVIIDKMEKVQIIRNLFPFDGKVDYLDEFYWVGGLRINGEWKFPNGTRIPPELTMKTVIDNNNGCPAVAVSSNFLLVAKDCTEKLFPLCEMIFPSLSV